MLQMICLLRTRNVFLSFIFATQAEALSLEVLGWAPVSNIQFKEQAPLWLGDDPIVGRLACPSLTRLEVSSGRNLPLLLKVAPTVEKIGKSEIWTLNLRQGLRWWSGENVESEGLNEFLKQNLTKIVQSKLGINLTVKYETQIVSTSALKIIWPENAPFGPNILSGVSLTRTQSSGFECAGLYSATRVHNGVDLLISNGYSAKYNKIAVRADPNAGTKADHSVVFSMAQKSALATVTSINPHSCSLRMDVPMVTALVWNSESPLASSSQLRQALTTATPRGEILRTAAGDIGSLVSAPILRIHPGYESKSLVRSFSLENSSSALEKAGYKQLHIGIPRVHGTDKPVSLKILRKNGKQELLEKMISDSFASIGIDTKFFEKLPIDGAPDAVMGSFLIAWPSQDLTAFVEEAPKDLSDTTKPLFPFKSVSDKALRDLAAEYARSLTQASPDFSILRKIHARWSEVEPWTLLLAHQYCVETKGLKGIQRINILDPDWFRHIAVD